MLVFYNISFSWLFPRASSTGRFPIILLRDSENDLSVILSHKYTLVKLQFKLTGLMNSKIVELTFDTPARLISIH